MSKYIFSVFCITFMSLCLIGCRLNLNDQILKMRINEEISLSELTREVSRTVYVLKGELSQQKFLQYCDSIKKVENYEFWEIALLVVDEEYKANVFIIHPFYQTLSTLNLSIEVDTEKPYNSDFLKIKKLKENEYVLYSIRSSG